MSTTKAPPTDQPMMSPSFPDPLAPDPSPIPVPPSARSMRGRLLETVRERGVRYRDLPALGISSSTLTSLVREGLVVEQGDGFRAAGAPEPSPYRVLASRYPGAIACLLTAQVFHDLTDASEFEYVLAVPRSTSRRSDRQLPPGMGSVRLVSWSNPLFYISGIEQVELPEGGVIPMTDRFRTAADMWRPSHQVDPEAAEGALVRIARRDGADGLAQVVRHATRLGFRDHVAPRVRAMQTLLEIGIGAPPPGMPPAMAGYHGDSAPAGGPGR